MSFARLAACCCLVAAAAAVAGPPVGKEKRFRIAGVGRDARGKAAPAESLTFRASGIRVTVQHLDGGERRAALASVLGREADLFPEGGPGRRGHVVFTVEIDNQTEGDVIFEPGQGRLISDRLDAEFPMDYTRLHEILARVEGAPSLEQVERAVFARAATVRPGGAVRKLLVFEEPRDGRYRSLELRLGALHTPGGDLDGTFAFRKFEVEP
jgi:hypothetical protein